MAAVLRKSILLLLMIESLGAHAAQVRLGPEIPISPLTYEAAAFTQDNPRVAENGANCIAIWHDERQFRWGRSAVYGTRIGTDGKAANPLGRFIAPFEYAVLACNGTGCLVVGWAYTPAGAVPFVQAIDRDANPIGVLQPLTTGAPREVASNGSSFLLATEESDNSTRLTVLDSAGRPVSSAVTPLWIAKNGITVKNGTYIVLGWDTTACQPATRCRAPIAMLTADASGAITSQRAIGPTGVVGARELAAGFSSDRILVGWSRDVSTSDPTSSGFALFDFDGNMIGEQHVVSQIPFSYRTDVFNVVSDGRNFLLTFSIDDDFSVGAIRVEPDGSSIDAQPFVFAKGPAYAPAATALAGSTLLAWSENRFATVDVFTHIVRTFDELPGSAMIGTVLTETAPVQTNIDLTANGAHAFAAWNEMGAQVRIAGSIDGVRMVLVANSGAFWSTAAVARGTRSYLIAWYDLTSGSVLARRIAFDGRFLDQLPITLGQFTRTNAYQTLAASWNADTFLVTWNDWSIVGRRIDEDGNLLDDVPIVVLQSGAEYLEWPSISVTPSQFFVAASGHVVSALDPGHTPPPPTRIWATLVETDGSTSPPGNPVISAGNFWGEQYGAQNVHSAWAGDRATIAWTEYQNPESPVLCISAMQTSLAGAVVAPARALRCISPWTGSTATLVSADIAWNGIEHVLVWSEVIDGTPRVYAIRLNHDLVAIDDSPIAISPDGFSAFPARVVATADGVVIAYSRLDHAAGDVARGFSRVLLRSDLAPARRRSARP